MFPEVGPFATLAVFRKRTAKRTTGASLFFWSPNPRWPRISAKKRIKHLLPGQAGLLASPRKTIGASAKRFCIATVPEFLGAICQSDLATGKTRTGGSAVGQGPG